MNQIDGVVGGDLSDPQIRGIYRSTKTYDHNEGLSCCFRQWRADSHCRLIHGYALAIKFVFATHQLDERNWCFDFGAMKEIKSWLHALLDHTMVVAADDPELARFEELAAAQLVDLRVLPNVGCEALARYIHDYVAPFAAQKTNGRVWLEAVEVREHVGNSAVFESQGPASHPVLA